MTVRRLLLALLAAAGLSSCSSLPSMDPTSWFGSGSTGPKPSELPVLTNAQGVRVLWSSNIGSAEAFVFSPSVVGDSVYVA
ncbi:MAG TPA: hypothetical protein VMU46_08050, partial [Burkholderiales bacterium]|nr:hypothetical protein [Burkholderiales bacterium]